VNRSVVAAGLLTMAAAGLVVLVAREVTQPSPTPTSAHVCAAAAETLDALSLSVADQVVLRARAAHLADTLIQRSAQEDDGGSLVAARRIVAVLDAPGATVADLEKAIEPVARTCPDLRSPP
jgi:hypothetical protein